MVRCDRSHSIRTFYIIESNIQEIKLLFKNNTFANFIFNETVIYMMCLAVFTTVICSVLLVGFMNIIQFGEKIE